MQRYLSMLLTGSCLLLAGCSGSEDAGATGPVQRGRYSGIGIYSADVLWRNIATAAKPSDPKAATTADDRTIIVTVDSRTGEVRQCGNLSGFCVGMNPWSRSAPTAPAALTRHAAEIDPDTGNMVTDMNVVQPGK